MKKLNVAVVGAGILGEIHAETFATCERAELIYIYDIDNIRAKKLSEKCNTKPAASLQDIISDQRVQAVSIATPDFAHTEVALHLIEAGKHLFIEKPLATSIADAERITSAARIKNIFIMVDFQNRWSPTFSRIKNAVDNGEIGKPVMGYIRLSNPITVPLEMLSWASSSGPQWFLFPHIIDLMRWFIDQEVREVYATGTKGVLRDRGIDVYDAIQAQMKFSEGTIATFETSWILPESWPSLVDFEVMLLGESGRIGADGACQGVVISGEKHTWPFTLGLQEIHGKKVGFFREPILYFVDSILNGRKPICSVEDGVAVTRAIECVIKSIQTERVINFEELG